MAGKERDSRTIVVVTPYREPIFPTEFNIQRNYLKVSEKVTKGECGELFFNQQPNNCTSVPEENPDMARIVDTAKPEYDELMAMIAADKAELEAQKRPTDINFTAIAASSGAVCNAVTGDLFDPRINWGLNGMVKTGTDTKQKDPFKL
jgi:hypothetical protein